MAGSDKFRAAAKIHELPVERSQKDCLLELFTHVVAMGCTVRVDLGFHISDAKIVVREHRISTSKNVRDSD